MSLIEFIIAVYVPVDDSLQLIFQGQTPRRRRGPQPTLSAGEVLTREVVGKFLGYDTDEEIFNYFYWHRLDLFPAPAQVHRTDFLRQAAPSAALWGGGLRP